MKSTPLGSALDDLVRDVGEHGGPPVDGLWQRGGRRRARVRGAGASAMLLALVILAFVSWPSLSQPEPPPVPQPAHTVVPDTYPSVLAHPYFAPDALTAHRAMTVAVLSDSTAYTIDSKGTAWKVPASAGVRAYAVLSPDGRWLVDGQRVFDLVEGRSTRVVQPGAPDDVQLWAAWAPDSAHYARAYEPSNDVVVSTPDGTQLPVPGATGLEQVTMGRVMTGGWLDDRTLMVVYGSLTEPTLEIHTWTIGDSSWRARGELTYPETLSLNPDVAALSSDGRTLAMSASDGTQVNDTALATWDLTVLSGSGSGPAARATIALVDSRYSIDGILWRGGTPLVTVSGRTGPVRGPALVESTAGFTGRMSWRQDALEGVPYWNAAAVWRARLVVWTTIPLAFFGVWLLWRAALWGARRLGIIDGPLPLRFDPVWWLR